jgi:hypothetical protein
MMNAYACVQRTLTNGESLRFPDFLLEEES